MDYQNDLMPGRYKGKIVSCDSGAVGVNKTPIVKLSFKLAEVGKILTWTGWFSDKVNPRSGKTYAQLVVDQLVDCGFSGVCPSEMSAPNVSVSTLFDTEKEWNLDVGYKTDKDGNQTKYFEIKWINDPDRTSSSKLDHVEAISVFKGMNLGGMIMQARNGKPAPKTKAPAKTFQVNPDDIPF